MNIQPTFPGDLGGLHVVRLAKLTAVDMTTAAAYNVYKNGPNTVMLVAWVLTNFSAFPDGTAPPATWACSFGTNSTTAPTNMRAAGTISAAPSTPVVTAQSFSVSTLTPYIAPFTSLYFAVTTTTNGLGTFDAIFYGGILNRN
ncbi:MAG TPA: hypothetical protein VN903_35585 [Polyangia bacterium]|nr:hypothetical protein [Polyangia bacterium]